MELQIPPGPEKVSSGINNFIRGILWIAGGVFRTARLTFFSPRSLITAIQSENQLANRIVHAFTYFVVTSAVFLLNINTFGDNGLPEFMQRLLSEIDQNKILLALLPFIALLALQAWMACVIGRRLAKANDTSQSAPTTESVAGAGAYAVGTAAFLYTLLLESMLRPALLLQSGCLMFLFRFGVGLGALIILVRCIYVYVLLLRQIFQTTVMRALLIFSGSTGIIVASVITIGIRLQSIPREH